MKTTTVLEGAAVDALIALLPAAVELESTLWPVAEGELELAGMTTLAVDYLGAISAELSIALPSATADAIREAGGSSAVFVGDVLRPALEAAAQTLGSGVLGEVVDTNTLTIFTDADAAVYRISEPGSNTPFAWFAVQVKDAAQPSSRATSDVSARKLGRIHDVEMALSVVIGRTRMTVANLLALEPGDVVDLDRSAGAAADILLNGRLIAHGEVVVVDQEYAVRVTKILDAAEAVG